MTAITMNTGINPISSIGSSWRKYVFIMFFHHFFLVKFHSHLIDPSGIGFSVSDDAHSSIINVFPWISIT